MTERDDIQEANKKKFEQNYSIDDLSISRSINEEEYFHKLIHFRIQKLIQYGSKKSILDVGCGTGDYLFNLRKNILNGIGIDFIDKAIKEAVKRKIMLNADNLDFVKSDALRVPFEDESFDLVFSFGVLYATPNTERIILEMSRVLRKSAYAIFELGNIFSLNTVVTKSYSKLALPCHISITKMQKFIKQSGFVVREWHPCQFLPLWGKKPLWLRPLLLPLLKRFLQKEKNGEMIDMRISRMPVINRIAFRHIFVCEKVS